MPKRSVRLRFARAFDRISRRRLSALATFCLGGAGVGAITNYIPLVIAPAAFGLGMILATQVVVQEWEKRPIKSALFWSASLVWALVAVGLWHFYFEPKIEEEALQKAEGVLATHTSAQCKDFGRKEALEFIAKKYLTIKGKTLGGIDLDCFRLPKLVLPPKTILRPEVSMAGTIAPEADFRGVDMGEVIASNASFVEAHFDDAILENSILGRHVLFDRTGKPKCWPGADLTGATFDRADLKGAWLVGVKGLKCDVLRKAKNWSEAVRDEECGAPIPVLPKFDYIKKWPIKCE